MVHRKYPDFGRLKWVVELSGFCAKTKKYPKCRPKTIGNPYFAFRILVFSAAGEKVRFSWFQDQFAVELGQFSVEFLRGFKIFLTGRLKWFFMRFQNRLVVDLSGWST